MKLNRQLKEKLRESSQPTGVEELSLQPRCDFAVNAFKEVIVSIDSEIEKIKGSVNMEEGEGLELQEAGERRKKSTKSKDSLETEQKDVGEEGGSPQ